MPASGHSEFRFCGEHHGVPARRLSRHGGNACHGARTHHAGRKRHLPARRFLVSGRGRGFHLDGAVVPTVVRSDRQDTRQISHLQGLEPASAWRHEKMKLEIDQDRLLAELETLATFSDAEPPAVTRVVFTPTDQKARAWLIARCEEADPKAPVVGTGSHIDAISNAGKYDGVVGVLGGLEAIRALRRAGFQPGNSVELLVFATEEPTRFGVGCLGSRLLSGSLLPDAASQLRDSHGESMDEVRKKAGFSGKLEDVKLVSGYYK